MGAEQDTYRDWLDLARDAHSTSSTYFDSNIRKKIEANMRQFQGLHPTNSKYLAESYKNRSKLFRPKTRASIRKDEAVCAGAFFSSEDVVAIRPLDDNDLFQQSAADVHAALLQYRLTKPAPIGIPWFLTLVGAYQECLNLGVIVSKQDWEYNEKKGIDRPRVSLRPVENIRIDPASDWTEPINSSPYVIDEIAMRIGEIKRRMKLPTNDPNAFFPLSDPEIKSAIRSSSDTIRLTREGRTDSKDAGRSSNNDFTVGWVHENIIEYDSEDYVFYTLGTEFMLTEPKPIREVYFHGRRPYVMGFCVIEPHKIYPASKTELVKDTQKELNEVVNERRDNVKRMLDPRWKALRNKQVDLKSLTRNVPSSVTLMSDLNDADLIKTPDATAACFNEQDRINNDFDEIAGNFSTSSVQSNRKLNETVGGMEILSADSDLVGEYQLKAFTETWVEPVLRQLVLLERHYENDELVLALAAKSAQIYLQGLTMDNMDQLLDQDVILNVNVGIGATNPTKQMERFVTVTKTAIELLGEKVTEKLKPDEIIKELYSKAGYKDGARFFDMEDKGPDPMQELQRQLMEAKLELDKATASQRKAIATRENITAIYEGVQAAQVISLNPGAAPLADQLLLSGGFEDANTPPIVNGQSVPGIQAPQIQQNTSPAFPPVPDSGAEGAMQGIETQRADGVMQ